MLIQICKIEAMILIRMEMMLAEMMVKAPRMMSVGHQAACMNQAFHAWMETCPGIYVKTRRMCSLKNKYYQLYTE